MENQIMLYIDEKQGGPVFKLVLKEILSRVIAISGCQSSGIRLEKNGDFPFFVYQALPDFFVFKENSLWVRDENDQVVSDQNGSKLLDCMCGNVIRRHFDPTFSFFSKKGSFWTNSTTLLLSSITEKQKKFIGPTRNLCNYSGYESVALIPLKERENVIGLIHLGDPRENMFRTEKIAELEVIAEESTAIITRATEIMEKLSRIDSMFLSSKD